MSKVEKDAKTFLHEFKILHDPDPYMEELVTYLLSYIENLEQRIVTLERQVAHMDKALETIVIGGRL